MKEFIAKYQKVIVGTGAIAVLVVCYFQQKELTKLRAGQKIEVVVGGDIQKANTIDSLNEEIFILHTQNGRYELTFEHLKEVNPKLGKEMEDWMNHETE
jgi:multidrug resistance efflux pump